MIVTQTQVPYSPVQLCRFVLRDDPEITRSGIFHENRLYETDGQNPIGVHDLGKVVLLPPVGRMASVRVFDYDALGSLSYRYQNPSGCLGPMGELDAPAHIKALEFEARLGAIVKDLGESLDLEEAHEFILGYTLMIGFFGVDIAEKDPLSALAHDLPFGLGPFLSTPDQVQFKPGEPIKLESTIKINGEPLFQGTLEQPSFEELLVAASRGIPVVPSDLILGPALQRPSTRNSALNRPIRPGDSIQFIAAPFGALTLKVV